MERPAFNIRESSLRVFQLGMHERGSVGGLDRFFWGLFDQLAASPDLSLSAFFFRHQPATVEKRPRELCLGPTSLSGFRRLWNLRRAVLPELLDKSIVEPTVVVSHFAFYAFALLPQLARCKHVIHFQGPWAVESATEGKAGLNVSIKRLIERAVYSSANAFITLSQAFKELLVSEYKVSPELIHVIPPAVDLQRFTLSDRWKARELLGWPQDAKILLCVRRLARRMGLEVLIEAFKEIAHAHPQLMLLLGGTGALQGELAAKIEGAGLGNRVRLLGFIPDDRLSTAYQSADISIVPSQSLEGFSLSVLESLACGTPVLVTPVGGLPEAVSALDPGLVFPAKDSAAIANGLDLFLRGGVPFPTPFQCRKYVEVNFAWPLIAQKVKDLYWQVAEQ